MSSARPAPTPAARIQAAPVWSALAAFVAAVALAVVARGLAGDEESAHFLIARYAPQSPDLFVSLVGRPLVTLALVLPSQAGFLAARIASAAATALTAYAVAWVARRTGWVSPLASTGLLLIQPFFLAHAGTVMTEPWAAALVAVVVLAYVERRYFLFALAAALLPLARFEAMVFWPLVIWSLYRGRRLRHVWLLALPLPLWNLGGWLVSGDPLWLLHQTALQAYPQRSPFHYLQSLGWILGAGLVVPVMLGLAQAARALAGKRVGARKEDDRAEGRRRTLAVSASVMVGCLLVYTALAWWRPVTFGNLRYFAFAAPALALLAAAGIDVIRRRSEVWAWAVLGATAAIAFAFWSHPLLGDFTVLDRRDFFFPVLTLPWLALYLLPVRWRSAAPLLAVALGVTGLVRYNSATLHLRPSPENEAVHLAADLLARGVVGRVPIHTAHPLLSFYAGGNLYDDSVYPPVTERTAAEAAEGTLMFWESHYVVTRGPTLTLSSFLENPDWRYLGGTVARDSTWVGAFFLRRTAGEIDAGLPSGLLAARGMDRDAWVPLARWAQTGVPRARVAAREDPRNPERWLDLATLASMTGLGQVAYDAYRRAVAIDPENPRNHAVRADVLMRGGKVDEALAEVRQALAMEPGNPDFLVVAGRILLAAKRPAEAAPYLREAAEGLPNRWDVQYTAGRLLLDLEQYAGAEKLLENAQRLNPRHVGAAIFAARAQMAQSEWDRAEDTLRGLIRRRPELPDGYRELGDLLYALRREDEARAVWREGAEAGGDSEELRVRIVTGAPPQSD